MRILALESSTTSAKAMVYDTETKETRIRTEAYGRMYEEATLHNADIVYEKTMAAGRNVLQGQSVDVVSLCTAWHSVCLCGQDMKPVTPVYPWSYTGASDICRELRKDEAYVKRYYHTTGCMVNATYPFFKLLMLKQQGYRLEDYYIMGQGSYNTYRLTGKRVATQCMISGSGLLDIKHKTYASDLLKEAGIPEDRLSELISYEKMYPLGEEGAKLLGISPGIPVVPANSDGGLNQVGVGALAKGVMTFSVGTSGAIRLTTPEALIPETPSTWCYLSPKSYMSGAAVAGCCICIDWLREQVGNGISYSDLESGVIDTRDTPVFLPFVFGERCPGWEDERAGGFSGLRAHHGIKHMYRAVQEGILFNIYHCYQMLTEINEEPTKIKLSGGILNSEAWTQMCADIFQKDMEVDEVQQGSLMGAVVLAMDLMGVKKAEAFFVEPSRVVKPNPDNAEIYQEKFRRYLKYYYLEK
ncbi:MAG: FGGY-family carbohydrate kinase [Lachnospiraceae bacterium]|nr:FGGY-family carbohydrate kinase [Lachnospiraceae bacterium]MDD3795439.1 FGGY-family carbohydrate kinase [Lachnospiraceae bacterium]